MLNLQRFFDDFFHERDLLSRLFLECLDFPPTNSVFRDIILIFSDFLHHQFHALCTHLIGFCFNFFSSLCKILRELVRLLSVFLHETGHFLKLLDQRPCLLSKSRSIIVLQTGKTFSFPLFLTVEILADLFKYFFQFECLLRMFPVKGGSIFDCHRIPSSLDDVFRLFCLKFTSPEAKFHVVQNLFFKIDCIIIHCKKLIFRCHRCQLHRIPVFRLKIRLKIGGKICLHLLRHIILCKEKAIGIPNFPVILCKDRIHCRRDRCPQVPSRSSCPR